MRHGTACPCVGSDEAVFARFVMTAATGEREDAMLVATLLVRADVAPVATAAAQSIGLTLLRGAQSCRAEAPTGAPASATRH